MKKLDLNALKERAQGVVSEELLNNISGGKQNACHIVVDGDTITIYGPTSGTITIHP